LRRNEGIPPHPRRGVVRHRYVGRDQWSRRHFRGGWSGWKAASAMSSRTAKPLSDTLFESAGRNRMKTIIRRFRTLEISAGVIETAKSRRDRESAEELRRRINAGRAPGTTYFGRSRSRRPVWDDATRNHPARARQGTRQSLGGSASATWPTGVGSDCGSLPIMQINGCETGCSHRENIGEQGVYVPSTSFERSFEILEAISREQLGLTNKEISLQFGIATSSSCYILSRLAKRFLSSRYS
jgi:hypothetical protein